MQLYNETNGHNWKNNKHWGYYSLSHCLWYGITCDPTNRSIISIFLERNNLVGTLPQSLWRLRNLQGLCLGGNGELQGEISKIVSENMTNLLQLGLSFNNLSGRIPGKKIVRMKSFSSNPTWLSNGGRTHRRNSTGHWKFDRLANSLSWGKQIEWFDTEKYCKIEETLVSGFGKYTVSTRRLSKLIQLIILTFYAFFIFWTERKAT